MLTFEDQEMFGHRIERLERFRNKALNERRYAKTRKAHSKAQRDFEALDWAVKMCKMIVDREMRDGS
jgi:hypothetical protein